MIRTLLVRMIFQYFNCYNGIPYSIYLNHHISRERKMNEDMHFKKSCKCNKTIESRTQSSKIFSFHSPFFLIPLKMKELSWFIECYMILRILLWELLFVIKIWGWVSDIGLCAIFFYDSCFLNCYFISYLISLYGGDIVKWCFLKELWGREHVVVVSFDSIIRSI